MTYKDKSKLNYILNEFIYYIRLKKKFIIKKMKNESQKNNDESKDNRISGDNIMNKRSKT